MTKRRPLPPADLATLRQRYPHEPTARIAADMGRTVVQAMDNYTALVKAGVKSGMGTDSVTR